MSAHPRAHLRFPSWCALLTWATLALFICSACGNNTPPQRFSPEDEPEPVTLREFAASFETEAPHPLFTEASVLLSEGFTPAELAYFNRVDWLTHPHEAIVLDPVMVRAVTLLQPLMQRYELYHPAAIDALLRCPNEMCRTAVATLGVGVAVFGTMAVCTVGSTVSFGLLVAGCATVIAAWRGSDEVNAAELEPGDYADQELWDEVQESPHIPDVDDLDVGFDAEPDDASVDDNDADATDADLDSALDAESDVDLDAEFDAEDAEDAADTDAEPDADLGDADAADAESEDTDVDAHADTDDGTTEDAGEDVPDGGDTSEPRCGNGQLDPGEACDSPHMNGQTCQSFGFNTGTLSCSATCQVITDACEGHLITVSNGSDVSPTSMPYPSQNNYVSYDNSEIASPGDRSYREYFVANASSLVVQLSYAVEDTYDEVVVINLQNGAEVFRESGEGTESINIPSNHFAVGVDSDNSLIRQGWRVDAIQTTP